MKYKLFAAVFLIIAVVSFWISNESVYGGLDSYERFMAKGKVSFNRGKLQESIGSVSKAVDKKPKSLEATLLLASLHKEDKDFDEAIINYKKALELDYGNEEAVLNLVSIYSHLNMYNELETLQNKYIYNTSIDLDFPSPPVVDTESGEYHTTISVSLKSGNKIYYTLDGSDPSLESSEYKEPIFLSKGNYVLKAVSVNEGLKSDMIQKEYNITCNNCEHVRFQDDIELSLKNYLEKDLEELTEDDIDKIERILILGSKIYFEVDDSYSVMECENSNYNLKSVNVVKDSQNVEYTFIPKGDLYGADDLKNFKNLKMLHIYCQTELNFSHIKDLENLEELKIVNSSISNLEYLNNLKELKKLYMIDVGIEYVPDISGLQNLETIDFSFNKIEDVSLISNRPNLKYLDISSNSINNIKDIFTNENLDTLIFNDNNVSDLSGIENLKYLKNLSYNDNKSLY